MALAKSDNPDLLLPGLKAEFAIAYKTELDASTTEKWVHTVINTTMPVQKYPWLGAVPREPPSPHTVTLREGLTGASSGGVQRRYSYPYSPRCASSMYRASGGGPDAS